MAPFRHMKKSAPSAKVIKRYALLQIPSFGVLILLLILLRHWVNLPEWFFWGAILVWLVKDVVLFPVVWRAYDWDASREWSALVGEEGIVEERLAPSGYIRVHGELWRAEVLGEDQSVERGERVEILGTRGLRLQVKRKD